MTLKKAQPNNMRRAIDQGEKALKIHENFDEETKIDEKVYKRLTKLRYLLADLYSFDVYNTYAEAVNMIEDFEDDYEREECKAHITSGEVKQFKKLKRAIEVSVLISALYKDVISHN